MRRRAFTLIELLVVIAIIAILAAILFPVFTQARAKGRQAKCMSNLRQLATAVLMYAEDYDEQLPPSFSWYGGWPGGPYWSERIQPYVRNKPIGVCPEKGPVSINWYGRVYEWTYALSYGLMHPAGIFLHLERVGQDEFSYMDAARTMLIAEGICEGNPPDVFFPQGWAWKGYHELYHNEKSDVAFLDGHVKPMGRDAKWDANGVLRQ